MAPLEIQGTIIKLLHKTGKEDCPKCKRDFDRADYTQKGDVITKFCPRCKKPIKTYSAKKLEEKAAKPKKP